MNQPDYRALCSELTFCWSRTTNPDDFAENVAPIVERMKAALAQPEPVGPTDEELLALSQFHGVSYTLSNGSVVYPMQEGTDMKDEVLSFARAVLQCWAAPPSPSDHR